METDRTTLIEVIRLSVRALDEVAKDLESLGRTPTDLRLSIRDLRDLEYQLISEPPPGSQVVI